MEDNIKETNVLAKGVKGEKAADLTLFHSHLSYSSPLPPPEILEKYEHVKAGSMERLLVMAENQAKHRQKNESILVKSHAVNENLGLISGLIIYLSTLFLGGYLIKIGKDITGFITLIGTIIFYAFNFLKSKKEGENTKKES